MSLFDHRLFGANVEASGSRTHAEADNFLKREVMAVGVVKGKGTENKAWCILIRESNENPERRDFLYVRR